MNTNWSTYVQKAETLYTTRTLRFSDRFAGQYKNAFCIDDKRDILEIGCGPGALTQALARWYPDAYVIGSDRDSAFVEFASRHAPHLRFDEADATTLPYADNSFDVTISNTVQEHIEPSRFFGEQYRVLREGGVCLVLSGRRGITNVAPCITEMSEFEEEIYARTENCWTETDKRLGVGKYSLTEAETAIVMQKYGFREVSTAYLTVNLTPDNPEYDRETAIAMINANRQVDLNSVDCLAEIAPGLVSKEELDELRRIKNAKYDKRIELYDAGVKQWDTNVSVTMVLRGVK